MEKKAKKKKTNYPSKLTLNLVMRENSINRPIFLFPIFIILAVAVLAFSKFAVIDRLAAASEARASLAAAESQLKLATAANADYTKVLNEYNRYYFNGYSESEKSQVDRVAIITLLEQKLIYTAKISMITVMGNKVTVNLAGVTLEELSNIMRNVKTDKNVSDVTVFNAGTQSKTDGNKLAAVSLIITLAKAEKGGDGK